MPGVANIPSPPVLLSIILCRARGFILEDGTEFFFLLFQAGLGFCLSDTVGVKAATSRIGEWEGRGGCALWSTVSERGIARQFAWLRKYCDGGREV